MERYGAYLTFPFLILLTLSSLTFATPHSLSSSQTLYRTVETYLSNGGHAKLQQALKLSPGVLYNPLHSLTREDIPQTHPNQRRASDLDILRALRLPIPGVDSLRQIEGTVDNDECGTSIPTRVVGASSEFHITYSESTPSFVRLPVDDAVERWADVFQSAVPIRICFRWGGDLGDLTLGATSSGFVAHSGSFPGLRMDALYSPAMAASKLGTDVISESKWHLTMALNDKISWHYDINTEAPRTKYDLSTTVLHELTHGLFFSGTIKASRTQRTATFAQGSPGQFDLFMQVGDVGVARTCTKPSDLYRAITNPTLRFVDDGAKIHFDLYAPDDFEAGSTGYHFYNVTFEKNCEEEEIPERQCSDLMTHQLENGYTQRVIGEPTLRVYRAMRGDRGGVPGGEVCEIPNVQRPPDPSLEAAAESGTPFQFPTWGVWTVAIIAGIGSILVVGVVISSIISKRGNR